MQKGRVPPAFFATYYLASSNYWAVEAVIVLSFFKQDFMNDLYSALFRPFPLASLLHRLIFALWARCFGEAVLPTGFAGAADFSAFTAGATLVVAAAGAIASAATAEKVTTANAAANSVGNSFIVFSNC